MIIAVDFDGTIVEHQYPKIGAPIPFAIETLIKLRQEHYHRLILWTVRTGKELQDAIDYCKGKGLEFYSHNSNFPEEELDADTSRKVNADLYIDDRNFGGLPDWGVIYQMIISGKYLNPVATDSSQYPSMQRKESFWSKLFK